jgi:hypothetical protein
MGLKNYHDGETCIIIGNGPSLNDCPRRLLNKHITFGSNKIYALPFQPNYYCIIDKAMLKACMPVLRQGWRPQYQMFLRAEACLPDNYPIYPVRLGGWSKDIDNLIVMGGTVTYAMLQIASWMGFRKFLLVGVDHYYPKAGKGQPGGKFVAQGSDPDHFETEDGTPYFEPGETYNRPELKGTTIAYQWAREYFEQCGKECINLTPGSKLDVFERGTYDDF